MGRWRSPSVVFLFPAAVSKTAFHRSGTSCRHCSRFSTKQVVNGTSGYVRQPLQDIRRNCRASDITVICLQRNSQFGAQGRLCHAQAPPFRLNVRSHPFSPPRFRLSHGFCTHYSTFVELRPKIKFPMGIPVTSEIIFI